MLADVSPRFSNSSPLAGQVAARLEESLKSHPPGKKLPSERQIASQLGVSRVTVREALLRLESDGRIHRHVGRGTFVADTPPPARTATAVGLWCVGFRDSKVLENVYFHDIAVGAEREVAASGKSLPIFFGVPADYEAGLPPMLSPEHVGGALLTGAMGKLSPNAWQALRRMPFVSVGRCLEGQATNYVISDDEDGVNLALGHLWDMGHRRIGFAGLDSHFSDYDARADAYEAFMRERGAFVPEHKLIMPYHQTPSNPTPLFRGAGRPTAILSVHDGVATAVLAAARQAGLRLPQDLSLVGFADTISGGATPPLTTVWFDKAGMGAEAARRLLAAMKQGRVDIEPAVFPVKLIERASCAPPPA